MRTLLTKAIRAYAHTHFKNIARSKKHNMIVADITECNLGTALPSVCVR